MRRFVAVAMLLALPACGGEARIDDPPLGSLPTDRLALPEVDLEDYHAILNGLRGTPVVVNVWGSWCPPCRMEAPALAAVAREYWGRVQFIGIDILDDRGSARAFIREFDWPYPSLFDPRGAIRDGLGYVGQPVTIVYDAEGAIAFDRTGEIDRDMLSRELDAVLA